MKVKIEIELNILQNIMAIIGAGDPLKVMISQAVREDISAQVTKQIAKVAKAQKGPTNEKKR